MHLERYCVRSNLVLDSCQPGVSPMGAPARPSHVFRFHGLEVDLRAGELRKDDERIKLQEQPLQILRMLLERPGEIVTREEIQQKLWPTDTFVEFDHSINAAIQILRRPRRAKQMGVG